MNSADKYERNIWTPTLFLTRETKRPGVLVVAAGLVTTAATLSLLSVLAPYDLNPMGFYVDLLPIGALFVGMAAGSGYGVASWLTGAKMGRGLLVVVVVLQIGAYFAGQYVEYAEGLSDGSIPAGTSFEDYFDAVTRSFTFQFSHHAADKPAEPWGAWGYLLRLMELAGFAAGGAIAPALLFDIPYCEACQVYMRTTEIGHFGAGVRTQKISKRKKDELQRYQREQAGALEEGLNRGNQLAALVKAADADALQQCIEAHGMKRKDAVQLTSHVALAVEHCPRCHAGNAVLRQVTAEKQAKPQELWRLPLGAPFVEQSLKIDASA